MIVVMGGTGLIGKALVRKLNAKNNEVTVLTRNVENAKKIFNERVRLIENPDNNVNVLVNAIERAKAVVNLVGENIAQGRWSKEKKKRIVESRVNSVKALENAILKTQQKPKMILQASATGIYGDRGDETCFEDIEHGKGFLAKVCSLWEQKSINFEDLGIHHKTLRFGVVFTPEGGFLKKLLPMFKFWVGAVIGSGQNYVPWVHIDDLVNVVMFLIENPEVKGTFNVNSPNPEKSIILNRTLGRVLHRPVLLKIPGFVMKLFLGQVAKELILSSQKAFPSRLLEAGFQFTHPHLEETLHDLLQK